MKLALHSTQGVLNQAVIATRTPLETSVCIPVTLLLICLSYICACGKRGGVKLVITALETSPRLRRLSMAGCQLGVDGGQAIIAAIGSDREQFRLLDLDLANNSLGPGSGDLLAVALPRNKTLTRLSLRCVTYSALAA